jgi:hypothetical protein
MLDRDLFAQAIGFIRNKNTVTPMELGNELLINQHHALSILETLEDCCLICKFDGFFASDDLSGLN